MYGHGGGQVGAEILLAWMSETGAGDVRDLRGRVEWFFRTTAHNPQVYESGRWLRDMATLGHVEVDWLRGRWAVTPPSAALLPMGDGTAVLTGARPLTLLDQLDKHEIAYQVVSQDCRGTNRLAVPPTVYLQTESIPAMAAALDRIGVQYAGYAARHIAALIPQVELGAPAAPPSWAATTERLSVNPTQGIQFVTAQPDRDGLYRWKVENRPRFAYRTGNDWHQTDYATGVLWTLADQGESVVRWRHERSVGGEEIGTVFVDHGAPLPPLQARALVLCSGLVAKFSDLAKTARYDNIPRLVADRVAHSIRQRIASQ